MVDRYRDITESRVNGDVARAPSPYRSAGEEQIARYLRRHRIPFFYEHPLAVVERGKTRLWYPDFQLQSLGLLVEYGGRLWDPRYTAGWLEKQAVYRENKLDAIMLTQDDLKGNWPKELTRKIEAFLEERLEKFRSGCHGLGYGGWSGRHKGELFGEASITHYCLHPPYDRRLPNTSI